MPYRDPKPEELNCPLFNAIWETIKGWDINVPDQYEGYTTASGNHVCAIMDAVISMFAGQDVSPFAAAFSMRMFSGPIDPAKVIDRKFNILAVNPVTGKVYTEENSLLLCAKDAAVPSALSAYASECVDRGAKPEHVESIELLRERVHDFQQAMGGGRVPDTVGAELPRCLRGEGL